MDIDLNMIVVVCSEIEVEGLCVEFIQCFSLCMWLEDNSVDLLFCYQIFYYLIDQEEVICEFYCVFKLGGILFFVELIRCYIYLWIICLLFCYLMEVQKIVGEYLVLVCSVGFEVVLELIFYFYLWWSWEDLGILECVFGIKFKVEWEEMLINLVVVKFMN